MPNFVQNSTFHGDFLKTMKSKAAACVSIRVRVGRVRDNRQTIYGNGKNDKKFTQHISTQYYSKNRKKKCNEKVGILTIVARTWITSKAIQKDIRFVETNSKYLSLKSHFLTDFRALLSKI